MALSKSSNDQPTAEESWRTIHESMDRARSSMYVAGSAPILLWWAAIASIGIATQYVLMTLAPDFIESNSWVFGALWGSLMVPGMAGSGFIGHRAGKKVAKGDAARSAGIKVFLYWMTVVAAMFLIPVAAGMWNGEDGDQIPMVTMGIVSLAYILFGIMHHTVDRDSGSSVCGSVLHTQCFARGCCHAGVGGTGAGSGGHGCVVDAQEWSQLRDADIVLDETIHQSTRLRIMTILVSQPKEDRVAYGFIQSTLDLTGGNLTTHLRKLEEADYLVMTKEFVDSKPRTWVQATPTGRRAFTEYLSNLERALNWQPET